MPWIDSRAQLQIEAQIIDKAIRLYTKDNWFCKLLAWLLFLVSFGFFNRRRFLENFATTIGPLIFIPEWWSVAQVRKLVPHEGRHVKHSRWLGLWSHPWVGFPLYMVLYLLVPFPVYCALFRYWFEKDADRQYWRQMKKEHRLDRVILDRAEQFGNTVGGWSYMHPLPTQAMCVRGFRKAAEKVLKEAA